MDDEEKSPSFMQCLASTVSDQPEWAGNYFRRSELSVDGTSIVTYTEDECLRTFILPPELLDEEGHRLTPYAVSEPFKSHAFALYPGFDLSDPCTTLMLQSRVDTPMRLTNALDPGHVHASDPLVNSTTEAFMCPHSLAFMADGSRFVAGSKELVSVFDVSRSGQGPIASHPTRPGRRARRDYGEAEVGLSGIVSALAISKATGMLAAGSTQRQVGIYDQAGAGERVSSFALDEAGNGVSQLRWDATGNYLFVAQRQADCVAVYDLRKGSRVCLLGGRRAMTTLRMGFEVVETDEGCHVWAGGTDGCVRVWRNVLRREGQVEGEVAMVLEDKCVSNVMMHDSKTVVFTTCGLRPASDVALQAWKIQ